MQRSSKQTRKINRWNAYLHTQVEAFNQGLQPGQPRAKIHEISANIRERWDAMTEEERIAATEDAVHELEDKRESKQAAKRESRISTTRDIRATLDAIENELQDLCTRTGAEFLLVSVRSDVENLSTKPRVFTSSPRVQDFFHLSTTRSVTDFALKLQAYCMADIQAPIISPALNLQQQVIDMKRKVKELINSKLHECAQPTKVARINYVDFETSMTERHGIVCENWPLPNFCAPGSINSLPELEVLYRAWSTGITTFRRLSPEEWHRFKEVRTQQRLQAAILQTTLAAVGAAQTSDNIEVPEGFPGPSSSPGPRIVPPSSLLDHASPSYSLQPPPSGPSREAVTDPMLIDELSHTPTSSPTSAIASPPGGEDLQYPSEADSQPQYSTSISTPYSPQASSPLEAPMSSQPSHDMISRQLVLFPDPNASTFVFSTGKRPPPSSFNVLGPMGLIAKKPRKKRADAGVKRGPNKRTVERNEQVTSAEQSGSAADVVLPASEELPEVLQTSEELSEVLHTSEELSEALQASEGLPEESTGET